MTEAQERFLARVREAGQVTVNGRKRGMIEILEAQGLVLADYDMVPQAKGNGMELVWRITVRPVQEG